RADPRLGPMARCLSRGRRPGAVQPPAKAFADAVAGREAGLRRLLRLSEAHTEARLDAEEARRELVDALLHCRALSLDVVEAFEKWQEIGIRGGPVFSDPQYIVRMKDDTHWLPESSLGEFLNFSVKSDPFFVVPSSKEPPAAPSNQMTPTLQARRQEADRRKAVLPLQTSLLRRIRKAELVIMKECIQARLQQDDARNRAAQQAVQSRPPSADSTQRAPAVVQELNVAQELKAEVADATIRSVGEAMTLASTVQPPPRPKPARPVDPPVGAFSLCPVAVAKTAMQALFEQYIQRVPLRISSGTEKWKVLENSLEDEGPGGLEWFWIQRSDCGDAPGPSSAFGLAVFRLKRMSTAFGQLLHFSTVEQEGLEDVLNAVKSLMFAYLPIKTIRLTLWYSEQEDGSLALNKEVEASFKKHYFRWFQLTNSCGIRGQVMQRPRGEPPDDPELPTEVLQHQQRQHQQRQQHPQQQERHHQRVPSLELCLGQ
ncbi:unnamed protein product, partial [Polarella glacialis]